MVRQTPPGQAPPGSWLSGWSLACSGAVLDGELGVQLRTSGREEHGLDRDDNLASGGWSGMDCKGGSEELRIASFPARAALTRPAAGTPSPAGTIPPVPVHVNDISEPENYVFSTQHYSLWNTLLQKQCNLGRSSIGKPPQNHSPDKGQIRKKGLERVCGDPTLQPSHAPRLDERCGTEYLCRWPVPDEKALDLRLRLKRTLPGAVKALPPNLPSFRH